MCNILLEAATSKLIYKIIGSFRKKLRGNWVSTPNKLEEGGENLSFMFAGKT
jgi:hypothetical protein